MTARSVASAAVRTGAVSGVVAVAPGCNCAHCAEILHGAAIDFRCREILPNVRQI